MPIKFVKSIIDFEGYLKNNRLLVLNFTASWCGPCKAIKHVVDQAYGQFQGVEIVRIDLDSQRELASKYSITSVPTFVFIETGKEVDRIQGANPQALISKLQEFNTKANGQKRRGNGTTTEELITQNSSLKDIKPLIPENFEVLNATIDFSGYEVLNCLPLYKDSKAKHVVSLGGTDASADKSAVISDSDSQLLFYIPFLNISKIYSILVKVKSTKTYKEVEENTLNVDSDDLDEIQPPNLIKVWCNTQSILSFDEASADANAPHVEKLSNNDEDQWFNIKFKFVRFQNVQNLTIFVDGEDEDYHTVIEKIVIVGVNSKSEEQ
ncbi:HSP70 interacting protein/thioredoxin chimera, putative [Candida dubliniensis CD36]|uniref:HSP70 interacting protein/thioredoxin chimera, putative n=1 Tax=Candida dubliniensis (strain CD36 / ATCC MYA-646 / CBS 7987 / NCPF 3949 / NRRL Y-17841) TaxID=573826 RepID=B9W6S7_CANDC|nr:HSP70 interacting protein/thioredoxin chimera, putative [Candida dubliniensis CD36]CAX44383.1 HSP70 interacting protein/thioredoxin chimera, putative [Candida dubliniensis CD36]